MSGALPDASNVILDARHPHGRIHGSRATEFRRVTKIRVR